MLEPVPPQIEKNKRKHTLQLIGKKNYKNIFRGKIFIKYSLNQGKKLNAHTFRLKPINSSPLSDSINKVKQLKQ